MALKMFIRFLCFVCVFNVVWRERALLADYLCFECLALDFLSFFFSFYLFIKINIVYFIITIIIMDIC